MPRFFVKTEQIEENKIQIIGEDVKHIKNVLRKQIGDIIEICNSENGKAYNCEIINIEEKYIDAKILKELKEEKNNILVDIYQGIPKSDKMELIIQKSVELGVNAIIPVAMKRCVAKIEPKDENKKIERWQKISESAAKQSGRTIIPEVRKIVTIQDIAKLTEQYDSVIVAYENEKQNTIKKELLKLKNKEQVKIAVVIGPEGGLEDNDVKLLEEVGANIVTLGNRILRTETVALNILSVIMYELEI